MGAINNWKVSIQINNNTLKKYIGLSLIIVIIIILATFLYFRKNSLHLEYFKLNDNDIKNVSEQFNLIGKDKTYIENKYGDLKEMIHPNDPNGVIKTYTLDNCTALKFNDENKVIEVGTGLYFTDNCFINPEIKKVDLKDKFGEPDRIFTSPIIENTEAYVYFKYGFTIILKNENIEYIWMTNILKENDFDNKVGNVFTNNEILVNYRHINFEYYLFEPPKL